MIYVDKLGFLTLIKRCGVCLVSLTNNADFLLLLSLGSIMNALVVWGGGRVIRLPLNNVM